MKNIRIQIILVYIFWINFSFASQIKYNIGDVTWVFKKLQQHPELVWLLAPNFKYTFNTETVNENSWSLQFIGVNSNEFEKTLASLYCLELILDGTKKSYEVLVLNQKEKRLSFMNYMRIHNMILKLKETNSIFTINNLEKFLIFRDLGKSSTFKKYVKSKFNIDEDDPHFFIKNLFNNNPEFCCYILNTSIRTLKTMMSCDTYHFGHILNFEGGMEMFKQLKDSKMIRNDQIMNFKFLTDILEIAAYNSHKSNKGSITLNDAIFSSSINTLGILKLLRNENEVVVMKKLLEKKAQALKMNATSTEEQIIVKLCALTKISSAQSDILKKIINSFDHSNKEKILLQLNPLILRNEKTATYIPGFWDAILSQKKEQYINNTSDIEIIRQAATLFIPLLTDIYTEFRESINNISVELQPILSFNVATKQILEGFLVNNSTKFKIKNGVVYLFNPS
ncbi:MAG: hypothetical protein J0M23_06985 [Rickettsiales bacterium]|nr:hypothetical protein [Rickettsiales bacterium]